MTTVIDRWGKWTFTAASIETRPIIRPGQEHWFSDVYFMKDPDHSIGWLTISVVPIPLDRDYDYIVHVVAPVPYVDEMWGDTPSSYRVHTFRYDEYDAAMTWVDRQHRLATSAALAVLP